MPVLPFDTVVKPRRSGWLHPVAATPTAIELPPVSLLAGDYCAAAGKLVAEGRIPEALQVIRSGREQLPLSAPLVYLEFKLLVQLNQSMSGLNLLVRHAARGGEMSDEIAASLLQSFAKSERNLPADVLVAILHSWERKAIKISDTLLCDCLVPQVEDALLSTNRRNKAPQASQALSIRAGEPRFLRAYMTVLDQRCRASHVVPMAQALNSPAGKLLRTAAMFAAVGYPKIARQIMIDAQLESAEIQALKVHAGAWGEVFSVLLRQRIRGLESIRQARSKKWRKA